MSIVRVPSAFGPGFSDAVVTSGPGRWIFVAGQVGADDSGVVVQGDFAREADQCFERIRLVLEKCGAGMKDVVKINAFITDLRHYPEYAKARTRAFPDSPPSSAAVQVANLLLNAHLEVDAIAFVKD